MGFSKAAVQKATANRIDTRSLETALDTNWSEEFIKLGVAKLTYQTFLQQVWIDTDPPLVDKTELTDTVTDQEGNNLGTLNNAIIDCFQSKVQHDVRQYINEHFLDLFKTLADLKQKLLVAEQSVSAPDDIYLADTSGVVRKIRSLIFHTVTRFSVDERLLENYSFDKAQVMSATVELDHSEAVYSLDVVRFPGKEHGRLFIKQEKKKEEK